MTMKEITAALTKLNNEKYKEMQKTNYSTAKINEIDKKAQALLDEIERRS